MLALLTSSGIILTVTNEREHREDKNHNPERRLMLDKTICEIKKNLQGSQRILSHCRTQNAC